MNSTAELDFSMTDLTGGGDDQELREIAHRDRLNTMGVLAAGMSHELAQPLLAAHNFNEVARSLCRNSPVIHEELVTALRDVHLQIERAVQIVKRMQRFIAKRSPLRESFDLSEAAHEAIALPRYEFLDRKIRIKPNLKFALPPVFADHILVQQVIVNLLRNAMEATARTSFEAHDIEVETALDAPDHVRLSVTDRGPGIEAENLDSIFTPFHSTKSSGLGLGLSLSRTMIEANDGRLWAENRPSGGAIFTFTLPIAHGEKL